MGIRSIDRIRKLNIQNKIFFFTMVPFTIVIITVFVITVVNDLSKEYSLLNSRISSVGTLFESGNLSFLSVEDIGEIESIVGENIVFAEIYDSNGEAKYRGGEPSRKYKSAEFASELETILTTNEHKLLDVSIDYSTRTFLIDLRSEGQTIGALCLGINNTTRVARILQFIFFNVLVSLLGILVLYFTIRIASRREILTQLEHLTKGVNEMSTGNLKKHIEIISYDELGQLAKAFNTMADNLNEVQGKLEASNKDLENKVEARSAFISDQNKSLKQKNAEIQDQSMKIEAMYFKLQKQHEQLTDSNRELMSQTAQLEEQNKILESFVKEGKTQEEK